MVIETPASSHLVGLWGQVIYPGAPWAPGICSLTHLWITCDCHASPPLTAPPMPVTHLHPNLCLESALRRPKLRQP